MSAETECIARALLEPGSYEGRVAGVMLEAMISKWHKGGQPGDVYEHNDVLFWLKTCQAVIER